MKDRLLEAFLARIYVDDDARNKFRADPRGEAERAGLKAGLFENMDWVGLELAARSFARKRRLRWGMGRSGWRIRLKRWFRFSI